MLLHSDDPRSQSFFSAVQRRLSTQAFETWFQPLCVTRSATDVLRIAVPNPAVRDWILSQYSTVLRESLLELQMEDCRIEWAIPQGDKGSRGRSLAADEAARSGLAQDKQRSIGDALTLEAPHVPDIPSAPLNEKYTFGSFVVASCNRFAHAAALAVAEAPGK